MKTSMRYVVRLRYTGDFAELEDWLALHCHGEYRYELQDVHETDGPFGQLEMAFFFSERADAENFRDHAKVAYR